ncbi:hypothetical protein SS50377_27029 [Spironucleus salmonicida]|uniref:Uncharacterized protein n=1 Tax=Spironucleus salmonicida TaxID=348837 RepID=A0A9P8RVS4_9EUKA|nr:hypothetical protein SS50377_27029 [Spironucleus salmonicida]
MQVTVTPDKFIPISQTEQICYDDLECHSSQQEEQCSDKIMSVNKTKQ